VGAPDLAARPHLSLDRSGTAAVVGGALAAWMLSGSVAAKDTGSCHWCEPEGFDLRARDALRWEHPGAAAAASDVLLVAVPLGSAAAVAWLGATEGGAREVVEDLSAMAAALAVTSSLTDAAKHGTGRLRPEPWAAGRTPSGGDAHSFFSSHTSRVFAAAAAATQVARLRRRRGWRWLGVASFTAAATTAWLRVGADQHWATDVLAGAASATAIGFTVPSLMLRSRRGTLAISPSPGGLAVVF
jgi:membrane-associated phospholipid phosphatase